MGKSKNEDICPTITIDSWNVEAVKNGENWESRDVYSGVESMSEVKKTKYLGDIIQNDVKN